MKRIIFSLFLFAIVFASCSKNEVEEILINKTPSTQIELLSTQDDIIATVYQSKQMMNTIKNYVDEYGVPQVISTLNEIQGEQITDKQKNFLISIMGYSNSSDFLEYLENLRKITEKYPILIEDESISKEVFLTINARNVSNRGDDQVSLRADPCHDACDGAYWAVGLGCAALGATCLPCGIGCAAVNTGVWIDCYDDCN